MQGGSNTPNSGYPNNLRIWFVGFGVGLAALIVGNKDIIKNIKDNPAEKYSLLGGLFVGVILQAILSLVNKYSNWINYKYCRKKNRNTRIANFFTWLGDQIWIDIIFDTLSVAALIASSIYYLIIIWKAQNDLMNSHLIQSHAKPISHKE